MAIWTAFCIDTEPQQQRFELLKHDLQIIGYDSLDQVWYACCTLYTCLCRGRDSFCCLVWQVMLPADDLIAMINANSSAVHIACRIHTTAGYALPQTSCMGSTHLSCESKGLQDGHKSILGKVIDGIRDACCKRGR